MVQQSDARDDFYIGYLPKTSVALAAWVRTRALLLLGLFALLALALVTSMGGFSKAQFEFGVERSFQGVLVARPYPVLLVDRPAAEAASPSVYSLVAFGKFGADEAVRDLDGCTVELRGSLIYRDNQTMIELVEDSLRKLSEPSPDVRPVLDLGLQKLRGEIVDSKCFLGVMKPGNLKPHRACATRCISGGIPPVLLVRDEQELASYYLLVAADGSAVNGEVLDFVAEPIEVEGRLETRGEQSFLYADPSTYRRLD